MHKAQEAASGRDREAHRHTERARERDRGTGTLTTGRCHGHKFAPMGDWSDMSKTDREREHTTKSIITAHIVALS